MICNRCKSALPSNSYICQQCGAMMSKEQIEIQKKFNEENKKKTSYKPNLMSEKYGVTSLDRSYESNEKGEKNFLGLFIVLGILLVIILIAVFKFIG